MADFFNLIRNENMKTFRRPRLYVMLGLIVGLIVIISGIWAFNDNSFSMWEVSMVETTTLFWIVTIFAVVVASSSVAEEFSTGTIKLLLIRPWSRSKILLSKYISSLLFAFFMTVIFLLALLLVNWLLFDAFSGGNSQQAAMLFTELGGHSFFEYIMRYFGLTFLNTVMTVTISFMLSTIFRSNILAIGLALFIEIVVNNALQLLALIPNKWVDYLLFVHLNLTKYAGSNVSTEDGMTLGFSLSVLAVYYVLFIALTWYIFNKRDVAS
ncbi:ABC transporter permease [Paenibacillus nanensis]|uniref:ABC transporter permease n=1 Tax=Paenibacillus nanensis TaxID=393251 RepID=A0A3A1V6E5_9BACL|nr:ABC transporter permease [Paenibacillus nanensis]RIX53090.1 ABC transporter permease [Paenibacillus nanensis]